MAERGEAQVVEDVEQSQHANEEVTPLVRAANKRTDQTSDDHHLVDENDEKNGWPGHASGEQQVHEQQRCSNDPVNVANVEDLARKTIGRVAWELDIDRHPTETRAHCKVGNGRDHCDCTGDVVEDAVLAWLCGRQAQECERGHSHDAADGKVPVGAMRRDRVLGTTVKCVACA